MKEKEKSFFKYDSFEEKSVEPGMQKTLYEQENMGDVYVEAVKKSDSAIGILSKTSNFLAPLTMCVMLTASSVFLIEKGFEVKRSFKAMNWIEKNCINVKTIIHRRPVDMINEVFEEFNNPRPSIANTSVFQQYIQALRDPLVCYYIAGFSAEYFITNIDNQ
tara:strand:- start:235 stop:720 length:486 start_codon:yes stop_codon:yes gene_type:complete